MAWHGRWTIKVGKEDCQYTQRYFLLLLDPDFCKRFCILALLIYATAILKEFIPVQFEGYIDIGGSTRPWKIIAVEKDSPEPSTVLLVLKLFRESHILQQNSIGKEFLGNYLASEFDLRVPDCGVVKLNSAFIATLEEDQRADFSTKHQGCTFASVLIEDVFMVNMKIPRQFNIKEYANVFAFDCFIMNADRGGLHDKPNVLFDDDGLILIDHELILAFADSSNDSAIDRIITSLDSNILKYKYEHHIFYSILKASRGNKTHIFDEFLFSLSNISIQAIISYINLLEPFGITFGDNDQIKAYLTYIKTNAVRFTNILYGIIS